MEHADIEHNGVPSPTLSDWALRLAPHLEVVSASVPEPSVAEGDVVAVSHTVDEGQNIIRSWERLEPADQKVGFVALGIAPEHDTTPRGVDPEGVGKTVGMRAAGGGAIGAVLGAIVGIVIGMISGWGNAAVVAILCGAALGAVAGAMFVVALRTAWGEAYRHSFVDQDVTGMVVCMISCRDDEQRRQAMAAVPQNPGTEVFAVSDGARSGTRPGTRPLHPS